MRISDWRSDVCSSDLMMLSESQERMLMVLQPGKESLARGIFEKWDLDFAIIGRLTDSGRMVLKMQGEVVGDLPIDPLAEASPEYDRPWQPTPKQDEIDAAAFTPTVAPAEALKRLMASPDLCSKRWVWEQYDHTVMRSEEHTSELQSLMRISYADFCLQQKKLHDTQKLPTYRNTLYY